MLPYANLIEALEAAPADRPFITARQEQLCDAALLEQEIRCRVVAGLGNNFLKPPQWIVKSRARKPARSATRVFDSHTLAYGFGAILVGFQLLAFAVFTKVFAITEGLLPQDPRMKRIFEYIKLETELFVVALWVVLGVTASIPGLSTWARSSFGAVTSDSILRLVMFSVFALILGPQIIFSSFFLSIPGLRRR